ncbi:MAG TPA: hypothetical protein VHT74_06250 [Acetobacteraceae bacterium]|jgi:hypothetical protein|nr:hypothetical protein [Acetobacteraceae bacterium]
METGTSNIEMLAIDSDGSCIWMTGAIASIDVARLAAVAELAVSAGIL